MSRSIRRRDLLRLSAAATGAALLTACLPEAATPSASPVATQSSAPSAAATASGPASGPKYAIGKLEGPTIVTDPAKYPKTLKEAPELAALVQQGKLPSVADRIGQDPLVIQPVHEIGKYGGTMHKAFVGVDDLSIPRFMTGAAPLLFWDYEWKTIKPNIARSFTVSPDNTTITVQLRRGMKWSDGKPFTADDIIFWFEDILNNPDLHPGLSQDLTIGGKQVTAQKIDDTTIRFVAPQPFPLLVEIMATPNSDVGATLGQEFGVGGPYAPKHYLQQFHAKYAGKDAADKLAADAKQNGWAANLLSKMQYEANPDLPVVYPWIVKRPATDATSFTLDRNPYSIWVDTDGNQLPYIGAIAHVNVQSLDVMALNATSGQLDFMELQFTTAQLPVLVQNQDKGGYKVYLDPEQAGVGIALNLAYNDDPTLGALYRNVDFRRALSLAIDRDQVNEIFFLGTATPSAARPGPENRYYPGDDYARKWATLDVAQANQLLDKIGLTQKDSSAYRLRSDGKRLTLALTAVDRIVDQSSLGEQLKNFWSRIGIDLTIDSVSSSLAHQRINANQAQMTFNSVGTEDVYLSTGFQTPVGGGFSSIMGVPYGQWINSGGKDGTEPFDAIKQAQAIFDKGKGAATADERVQAGKDLTKLAIDQVFAIGLVSGDLSRGIRIAKTNMGNIPSRSLNANVLLSPVGALAQTYYFK